MRIKVTSGASEVELPGVGTIEPGKWYDITEAQENLFELLHGYPLKDAHSKGHLEVDTKQPAQSKTKAEAKQEEVVT